VKKTNRFWKGSQVEPTSNQLWNSTSSEPVLFWWKRGNREPQYS